MKRHTLFTTLLLVALLNATPLWADIQWKYISTAQGLSNRRVHNIAKDSDGYIWFAVRYGIDRYDGKNIVSYEIPDDHSVMGVASDNSGRLLAYTKRGLYCYDPLQDSFALLVELSDLTASTPQSNSSVINKVYTCEDDKYWMALNRGLFCSDDLHEWQNIEGLNGRNISCITPLTHGVTLAGTRRGVVCIAGNRVVDQSSCGINLDELKGVNIQNMWYDTKTKMLWIGTFGRGLYIYETEGGTLRKADDHTLFYPIRAIAPISEDEVWIGMDGVGIKTYNRTTGQYGTTYSSTSVEMPILTNSIYSIMPDENTIWISTYSSGVMCYNSLSAITQHYILPSSQSSSNSDRLNVNSIVEDHQNRLWLGTNSGVHIYQDGDMSNHSPQNYQNYIDSEVIMCLYEDRDHDMWIGGYSSELICMRDGRRIEYIDLRHESFSSSGRQFINTIIQCSDNYIWFGGVSTPLTRYCKKSKKVDVFTKVSTVEKIYELNDRELLIGSYRGLQLFDKTTCEVRHLNLGLKNLSVISIIKDPVERGVIWLGTENEGLMRYNISSGDVTQLLTEDGLPANSIYCSLFDAKNRLWVSSESGVCCIEREAKGYSLSSFINSETFNIRASLNLSSGNLLYSNLLGVVEIDPEQLLRNTDHDQSNTNLHLSEFRISYDKVLASQENSPLERPIDECQQINLDFSQNTFSFSFADVRTRFDGEVLYQYRLVGFDDRWSTPSPLGSALFTNISPGFYRFEVRSLEPTADIASSPIGVDIVISPPLYLSSMAYLIYAIIIIAIILACIIYSRSRIERRNANDKINFFINMAHDIRIPITLVMAPLNELEREAEISSDGRNALFVAKKNINKLFKLVTELLDFQRMALQDNGVATEQTEINEFIKNSSRGFALMAHEKRIEFNLHLFDSPTYVYIDRGNVAKVLENLLSNAVKYTMRGGRVDLSLGIDATTLSITVSDNGIGIPSKSRKKIFTPFYRAENTSQIKEVGSGIGLLLTRKLVLSHHGKMSFKSKENEGSTFIVELPYNKGQYAASEIIDTEEILTKEDDQTNEDDQRRKILIVEDNDELRSYLARYMRKYYIVVEADNGVDALEKITAETPDIIISDIIMPKMTGLELCERVKSNIETSHIPFVILSSVSEKEDIVAGLSGGADDYITKPFDLAILESKISTILTNRSLARRRTKDTTAFDEYDKYMGELDKDFLRSVTELINENITNPDLTVDLLAQHSAMSRSVFFKKLKALTEQSPKDFIKEIKMRHAAKLICEQKQTIAEVAYSIGFPDAKYFSTAFKKYYGTTPTGYLEQQKKELNR